MQSYEGQVTECRLEGFTAEEFLGLVAQGFSCFVVHVQGPWTQARGISQELH